MRLQLVLLLEFGRFEATLVQLDPLAQRTSDVLHYFEYALLVIAQLADSLFVVTAQLEQFRHIKLQTCYLFLDITNLLVDDVKSAVVVAPILDLNLHQQLIVLAVFGKLLSVLHGVRLLAAHLDGRVDVEDVLTLRS